MTEVILTGGNGLLGSGFRDALLRDSDHRVRVLPHAWLTPDNPKIIHEIVREAKANIVINCAALVDAEAAEANSEDDYRANSLLPRGLAEACRECGAQLVQISSTGCYGDWKKQPYTEQDILRPTTVHHRHKAIAEDFIRTSNCEHIIARVGWLYGVTKTHSKNFVWNRIVEAQAKTHIVSDGVQRGCPTYVDDVVRQVIKIMNAKKSGTFNVVSQGNASRYDYVRMIITSARLRCTIEAGPAFRRKAPVSPNEMALNAALAQTHSDEMPHWETSLKAVVGLLTAHEPNIPLDSIDC